MSRHADRALLLYEQGRYDLADGELRQELTADPENPMAHALLALCLSHQEHYEEATREAELAVHQGPDSSFCHFALGSVLHDRNRLDEAAVAVAEAIRLDPNEADYFALLGSIRFGQGHWAEALAETDRGLAHEPEHVGCQNLRAMALVKLGRKQEAGATLQTALAKDPDNATTHANQGWALLEQRQHATALEHFREALRLDPQLDWAREGIVEALKARHVVYSLMLRYFLWMAKLSGTAQWGVIIGGWLGYRMLLSLARENPSLAPLTLPLLILYVTFAFLTWIAEPLFNLVLRLDRFGRLALSREQVVSSNWVGGTLLVALVAVGVWLMTGNYTGLLVALVFGLLALPLAGTFQCEQGWPRKAMSAYTATMGLMGVTALALFFSSPRGGALVQVATIFGGVFLLGAVLSGWVANALAMARLRK